MGRPQTFWKGERGRRAERLWHEGATYKEIAFDLGTTKSAVAGYFGRKGMRRVPMPAGKLEFINACRTTVGAEPLPHRVWTPPRRIGTVISRIKGWFARKPIAPPRKMLALPPPKPGWAQPTVEEIDTHELIFDDYKPIFILPEPTACRGVFIGPCYFAFSPPALLRSEIYYLDLNEDGGELECGVMDEVEEFTRARLLSLDELELRDNTLRDAAASGQG